MRHPLHFEHLGHWLIWVLATLLAIGLFLSSIGQSHGQDYWSGVALATTPRSEPTPTRDPYRLNSNAGYLGGDLSARQYRSDRSAKDRDSSSLRNEPNRSTMSLAPNAAHGFFDTFDRGLRAGNNDQLRYYLLGRWHQLTDLPLLFTRTDQLLFEVLAREAPDEQSGDDRKNILLQQWHDVGAQSRIDWERQCPEEAAWVKAHAEWFGPDSIEALTTRLQAVRDCPPGS